MVGKIIFGVAVILTFGLYCCVRVGSRRIARWKKCCKRKGRIRKMEKADKRKYAEDKPLVCEDCYFLEQTKNG